MAGEEEYRANEETTVVVSNRKKYIVMLAILIIQVLISYLLITFVFSPHDIDGQSEEDLNEIQTNIEEEAKKDMINVGEIFTIEDIVINPAGTRGRRFISLSIGIEVEKGKSVDELKKRNPKLCDAILSLLSKKSLYEFVNVSNREKIREEILEVVKKLTPPNTVKQIYITKFIIQ